MYFIEPITAYIAQKVKKIIFWMLVSFELSFAVTLNVRISQGNVATQLSRGGSIIIYTDSFIGNLPVKEF